MLQLVVTMLQLAVAVINADLICKGDSPLSITSKEIQQHVQKPNKEEGEEIVTFVDDVYPGKKVKPEEDEIVPDMLEPDEEAGEEEIVMIDDIPFKPKNKNQNSIAGIES